MAYPLINYASFKPALPSTEIRDIFSTILKGYQTAKEPARMERQIQTEEFRNKIKGAEAEHAPQYYRERAKGLGTENLFNALRANLLQQYGGREKEADIQDTLASTMLKRKQAEMGSSPYGLTPGQRTINSLPSNVRNDMAAQMQAWDIDPHQGFNLLASGATMEDLKEEARKSGVDVDNAVKIFAPTTSNITQQKSAEGAAAELDVLENETAKGIAPYARTFAGYSPKQIVQSLAGTNKRERIDYLASRALQPEIAGARARVAGGSNAQEALKEMQDKALGNSKIFQSLVTPEEYEGVQERINEILKEGFKARKSAIYNTRGKSKSKEKASAGMLSDDDLFEIIGGR